MFITEKTLLAWGYEPGTWSRDALVAANRAAEAGASDAVIRLIILLAWKRHGARSAGPPAGGADTASDAEGRGCGFRAVPTPDGTPGGAAAAWHERRAA